MKKHEEDLNYKDVIKTLHSLKKVSAPPNFEADLLRRINKGDYKEQKSIFPAILTPSRLIPSAVAVAAAIVFFFFSPKIENAENPLMADPQIREDVVSADEVALKRSTETDKQAAGELKGKDSSSPFSSERFIASASNKSLFINKSGLNFRQVRLSSDEKEQLYRLKAKIATFLNNPAGR